eukprot:CAMPEP_0183833140 /NCGR_PEP_ID=MMETSP0807_2-20130328/5875_1 /TAXON_ID=88271 /ORGANISM="Picocystis salinarum, Strain CCMP1897" /LENGTH=598 /DNA_ID=CAMNT_0026079015 /DNA_START=25 /DNA_END=1821 /DNA_ORIENTATION=-
MAMADAETRLNALGEVVRREAKKKLEEALDTKSGKKALVMERSISSSLSLVANTAMLKDHGVDGLYHLEPDLNETGAMCDYYFVRPGIKSMKLVAEHVKKSVKASPTKEFYVFCIPRKTLLCQKILEEEGVYGSVLMCELELEFLLPQNDVFSLEMQNAGKEIFAEGNHTSSFYLARALMNFQIQFGLIPHVLGKGKEASEVARIMSHTRKELGVAGPSTGSPQVQTMVLIDRQVDWITAMLTPLTYEGLIDDCFGIKNQVAEIPDGERGNVMQKVPLNDADKLYTELKNMNWVAVGKRLSEKTSAIKLSHEGYRGASLENQTVSELKNFVKKIQNLPELQRHVLLADKLAHATKRKSFVGRLQAEQQALEGRNLEATCEYLSDLMFLHEPLTVVLKLMCLLSVMYGGLPKKTYDGLRQDFLRSYGFQHLTTLRNLQDAGLLSRQEHGKNYYSLTKKVLKLSVDEELDEDQPSDVSFVYSGWYAPLSIRLVERAFSGGWRVIEDVLRLLPGPQFEIEQLVDEKGLPVERLLTSIPPRDADKKPLVLVVFVGGVTYAEIAALRWLNTQANMTHAFAIATTHLMSSGNVIGPMIETRKLA